MTESTMREESTAIYWVDANDELHRTGGPAVVTLDGKEEWWVHGVKHREGGPAVISATGLRYWYRHGVVHRDGEPAVIWGPGTRCEEWFVEGRMHRLDGPAVESEDGKVYAARGEIVPLEHTPLLDAVLDSGQVGLLREVLTVWSPGGVTVPELLEVLNPD